MEPYVGENKKDHIRYYFVLLLDILGQKEQLKKWSQLQPDGTVTAEMLEGIKGSLGQVIALRKRFLELYNSFDAGNDQSAARAFIALNIEPGTDRDRYNAIAAPRIKLLHFSDTLVTYAPVEIGPGKDWNMKALYGILASTCVLMPCFLAQHIVRIYSDTCKGVGRTYSAPRLMCYCTI